LAVGSQEFDADVGTVTVMYGSADGLTADGSTQFRGTTQSVVEWGESYPASDAFGSTLVAGDMNRDGADDLIVGATGEAPRAEHAWGSGAIHVLFGGAGGLTRVGERVLSRPDEADDRFGRELAVGDIDRDGNLDLVEAAPGHGDSLENLDVAGHVSYCRGTPDGPRSCRSIGRRARHGRGRSGGSREAPASLAVADVTGDGYPDILEGIPEDRYWIGGSPVPAGAILIRPGSRRGPVKRPLRIDQDTHGVPGTSEDSDGFGAAVAVGRLDRDRYADIVVAAPGENGHYPRNRWARRSGRVTVLHGAPAGVRSRGAASYDRRTPGLETKTALEFGTALAVLDLDGDRRLDLTVGSAGVFNRADYRAGGTLVTLPGHSGGFNARHAFGIDSRRVGVGSRDPSGLGTVIGH
jgi:hypothetical protein